MCFTFHEKINQRGNMETRRYQRYTPKEDSVLRKGATSLPGRTEKAVYQRRRDLGLVKPAKWTADEIKLAERNIRPEGRTMSALRCLRTKMGFKKNTKFDSKGQYELDLKPLSEHSIRMSSS